MLLFKIAEPTFLLVNGQEPPFSYQNGGSWPFTKKKGGSAILNSNIITFIFFLLSPIHNRLLRFNRFNV
jgi:hypothetical protein